MIRRDYDAQSALLLSIFILLMLSLPATIMPSYGTDGDPAYALIQGRGSNTYQIISELGVDVVEEYESYTLAIVTPKQRSALLDRGLGVIPMDDRTTIYANGYAFDFLTGEPPLPPGMSIDGYAPAVEGTYIVHLVGPIKDEWRSAIESAGGEVITYIPNYAYRVRMSAEERDAVESLPFVDWIGIYHPGYKVSPELDDLGSEVSITLTSSDTLMSTIASIRDDLIVTSEGTTRSGYLLTGHLDGQDALSNIANMADVNYINSYGTEGLHDEMGMQITGGGAWAFDDDSNPSTPYRAIGNYGAYANQLGWTGDGVVVGIADTGLGNGSAGNAGHNDFTGRVIGGYDYGTGGWLDEHGHGTHCAGLVGADGYSGNGVTYAGHGPYYVALGLAYESSLYATQIFEGSIWVGPVDRGEILEVGYAAGCEVHSNSWGYSSFGAYNFRDEQYDQRTRDADPVAAGNQQIIAFISSGNDGPDTNTVGSPGGGKNVITIGAVENYMPDTSSYGNLYESSTSADDPDNVCSFSSRGWQDDGRIKPDVVAPGQSTLSTHSPSAGSNLYGYYSEDNRYEWCSGTSQACPTAAGGGAVIYEWYEATYGVAPTPSMMKALVINTAMDVGTPDIPNQNEGWGRMYLPTLFDQSAPFALKDEEPELTTGASHTFTCAYSNPSEPLKITLAYTDRYSLEGANPALQNQVNLEVETPGGTVYHGNAFSGGWSTTGNPISTFDTNSDGYDDRNNVECVYIPPGQLEAGQYTIRIIGTNVPADCDNDGSNDQDYSLVVYNCIEATSKGTVGIQKNIYPLESSVLVEVKDMDLNANPNSVETTSIDVDSTTEPSGEPVTLTETGKDTGIFKGTITISATNSNGVLQVSDGDTITATYEDDDDGTGDPATVTDSALVDGTSAPPSSLTVEHWGITNTEDTATAKSIVFGNSATQLAATLSQDDDCDETVEELTAGGGQSYKLQVDYTIQVQSTATAPLTLKVDAYTSGEEFLVTYRVDGNTYSLGSVVATSDTDTYYEWDLPNAYPGAVVTVTFDDALNEKTMADTVYIDHLFILGGATSLPTDHNTLNWTLSPDDGGGASDIAEYRIYRSSQEAGPWDEGAFIASVPAGTSTYMDLDKGRADSTIWWYVVRANDTLGNLDWNTNAIQEPSVVNSGPNEPTTPSPVDRSSSTGTSPTLSVIVSDPEGDTMDVSFFNASDDSLIGTDMGVVSGGTASITWSGLGQGVTYEWYAIANDSALETQSQTWGFTTPFGISCEAGWNLVSLPLVQSDSSVASVLSSLDGDYDIVQWYDASSQEWQHWHKEKDASGFANTLTQLDHGMGIYINVTVAGELTLAGTVPNPLENDVALYPGWNLVGFPSSQGRVLASVALSGLSVTTVERFDTASGQFEPLELGSNYLVRGEGYWIYLAGPAVLWDVP